MILELLIDGLAVGSIYALVSMGLVLVFQATGTLNFAHGDIMMISTFVAYALLVQLGLPFIVAIPVALCFAAVVAMLSERLVVRRLVGGSGPAIIMGTLGISYILQGIASGVWSDDIFAFPKIFKGNFIMLGDIRLVPQNIGVVVSTIVIIVVLHLFLTKTKIGTGLRALTQNRVAASLMGVRVTRMYTLAWAIGGLLAAIAGVLLAPTLFLSTGMSEITFTAIMCAIIGGFGKIYGAVIGGYLVGIFSSILPVYIPTELQAIVPFILLMIVLFLKPTGLLGKKTIKKV
ncbi:MAG: branched-chain amino acid ABC transporter permease [Sphaerochaetaceae bacterium]|jgi:branched-chain amino acid transport system permease protein